MAALALVVLPGCGFDHLDAVGPALQTIEAGETDSAFDAAFDAAVVEASLPEAAPGDGADDPACTTATTAVDQWTFDSSVQGWYVTLDSNVAGTATWTGSTGAPSPGALDVDITTSGDSSSLSGGWVHVDQPTRDLTGRTLSARVWLESGKSPNLKVFAETGQQWAWADNGTIFLEPHVWTCVSLRISSPSYHQPTYDPTQVIRLGFEMLDTEPFHVVVDSVRVY